MICPRCGQLNESDATQCDSCYTALDSNTITDIQTIEDDPYDISRPATSTNGLAVGGMLLGIGSLITCCTSPLSGPYIPGILGFTGLILSMFGKKQISKNPQTQGGEKAALLGMIFGGISTLGAIITLILWLLGIMVLEGLQDYFPHLK